MTDAAPEARPDPPAIELLHRIGLALTELDPDRLVQRLTDEATAMCRAQFGAFFYNVLDSRGERYMLYTLSGVTREAFAGFPMPRATAIFRPTFDGTAVLRLDDVLQDPRYGHTAPHHGMPPGHLPVRSYLAVPVLSRDGTVLGGLFFGHAEPGRFTVEDERLMVAVAAQTGLALDNARLYAALEAREQQYRFLADAMPQIVWTARPDGEIDYVNHGWTDYTGLDLARTVGPGWTDVIHPEDRPVMLHRWQTSLRGGDVYEVLYRIRRARDGAYRWHLGRSVPRRAADGAIVQWVGTATDVDDQQRSSDALRFLASASAELSASLDYRAALANVARLAVPQVADFCAIDMTGPDGAPQRLVSVHVDPHQLPKVVELGDCDLARPDDLGSAARVLRSGRSVLIEEIADPPDPGEDPRARVLQALAARSWLCVPIHGRGRSIGAITLGAAASGRRFGAADLRVAEDLAVRVGVAIENARLYHDAQEANRAKDQFLATVSHELRTPLTAILGWTRMLRGTQLDDERRRRGLETIERSARAQTQLIEDLLDISRIISGKMRLEPRPIDPVDPIEAAFEAVLPAAEGRGVRMSRTLASNAGPIVADPDRLQQVVWNLLSNAVKFTPRGGSVKLTLRRDESCAEITVSDTGQGIAPGFVRHVFELFRQADAEFTRKHGGLGIGLAITRHLVELHGGTIAAHSEGEGRGATFTVRLPLGPLRAPSGLPEAADTRGAAPCPVELEGLRVLIVDDEPDVRDLLIAVLTSCKVEVFAASNVQEALALLIQHHPDVMISDIGMPGEDGYALIRQVRALPPESGGKIPALALTAYARMEDRTRALLAGFQMHVPKPLDPTELMIVLANLTGRVPR